VGETLGIPCASPADFPSSLHPEGLGFLGVLLGWLAHCLNPTNSDPRKQEIRTSRNTGIWITKRMLSRLWGDLRLAGLLTLELREHGQRVGFEAVGLGGRRATLAHIRIRSPLAVGRYGVDPDCLVPLIEAELVRPPETVDAFLIDEIGKMECHCPRFVASMRKLLDGPVPVVATISLWGGGFSDRVGVSAGAGSHPSDAAGGCPPTGRDAHHEMTQSPKASGISVSSDKPPSLAIKESVTINPAASTSSG
jgi:nucleoside-triphosphatase THEP1